jgi:amino-acid N-acetyltransferase
MSVELRRARTSDVKAIRAFVDAYAPDRKLLNKPTVTLYEDVQEFWVAEVPTGRRSSWAAAHCT